MYCFTTSISHGVEKYFPRLWGTGISGVIFFSFTPIFNLVNKFTIFNSRYLSMATVHLVTEVLYLFKIIKVKLGVLYNVQQRGSFERVPKHCHFW